MWSFNASIIFGIFRKDPECRNGLCTRQSRKEGFSSLERYSRQRGEVPIQCIPQGSLCGGNTCSGVYRFYISLNIVVFLMWISHESNFLDLYNFVWFVHNKYSLIQRVQNAARQQTIIQERAEKLSFLTLSFCYISGIKDFVPEVVQGGYEPFSNLVKKASRWINEEKAVNVTNFKSIHISKENGMLRSCKNLLLRGGIQLFPQKGTPTQNVHETDEIEKNGYAGYFLCGSDASMGDKSLCLRL